MLKHVVLWNLKDPAHKAAHVVAIRAALDRMRDRIPGLRTIEFGADIGCDRDARDVVLYAEFSDAAALDVYQKHPLHLEFKAVIGPLVSGRSAVDWEA